MEIPLHLQEIIISTNNQAQQRHISGLLAKGKIKKIAPKIYTGKIDQLAETIIRRNIFTIIGQQYKGAVLSHRSALEFKPTASGNLFLTYTYTKKIKLPGITLCFIKGSKAVSGDNQFTGDLYVSQEARAYLENLQIAKRSGDNAKILPLVTIEERLNKIIQGRGEEGINILRDTARDVALQLDMGKEFEKLNRIISSLLSSHTSKILMSTSGRARAIGLPYDADRIELFNYLFLELQQREFIKRPEKNTTPLSFSNFAFYESYFSNYIEGTVFSIEEAKLIIETQTALPSRDDDSHDILGTFQLVSNIQEMRTVPTSADHLLQILRYRHQVLLSARQNKQPGTFRDQPVYAGQTTFVDADLIVGTLIKAFDYYKILRSPFAKAIFIMFVIAEVHPFLDGNGRIARVMMNAELVAATESKIIIPTVYRDDYIGALRKLTRQSNAGVYIHMMERAHTFSERVYNEKRDDMENYLRSSNAFYEDGEGYVLKII